MAWQSEGDSSIALRISRRNCHTKTTGPTAGASSIYAALGGASISARASTSTSMRSQSPKVLSTGSASIAEMNLRRVIKRYFLMSRSSVSGKKLAQIHTMSAATGAGAAGNAGPGAASSSCYSRGSACSCA